MVRLDAVDLYRVAMPLTSPWRTAYGEDAACESVLVRGEAGGVTAWAETTPLAAPCYSGEWAGGAFACLRDWLLPAVVGEELASGEEVGERLAHFKGNRFAKAAVDELWWVMEATQQGVSLARLLGAEADSVEVGADFGVMDSIGELLASIGQAVESGYRRIKLKFRRGWDVDMLRAVRGEFPSETIHIDCNGGFTLDDTDLFCRLDDFMLAMIEQPLTAGDLLDHAVLAETIRTPICLDESIASADTARQAIELGSCKVINIKPGRVGGLTEAKAIREACVEGGIGMWVGGMLESAVGARICLAVAALPGFTYPADIFPSRRFYQRDLAEPELELITGAEGEPRIAVPQAVGVGAEPDEDRLAECCLEHARVAAD